MADLFFIAVSSGGARLVNGFVLELGPLATPDEIATIACRRILARKGKLDELAVMELVHEYDFEYVPLGWSVIQRDVLAS